MKGVWASLAIASCFMAVPAMAQDNSGEDFKRVMIRGGFAYLKWDEGASVNVGGQVVPGGTTRLSNNKGVEIDFSYFLHPNVSVAVAVGVPPTTTLYGAGTLESAGELGKVTYGPGSATVLYHVTGLGPVKPYLGAGVNYTIIFKTKDRLLQDFKAKDTIGPVLQGGVDIALNKSFGIYFDAKKIFATSDTTWKLPTPAGLAPGTAKVKLDPLVLNAGVSFRF